MSPRFWTCKNCGTRNPRTKQKCAGMSADEALDRVSGLGPIPCGGRRPAPRRPKHQAILDLPYEWWTERFGNSCNICGAAPTANRRLDRDHDHKTGEARGLLCHLCNRALGNRVDADWLEKARDYLTRAAA